MKDTGLLALFVRLYVLTFATLLLPYGDGAQRAPEPRTLNGTVYYVGGNQPAEHITVELQSTGGSMISPVTTSSTGWFEFRGLQRESYVIAIDAAGFDPVRINVDLALSSSRGNVIYLKPRMDATAKSSRANSVSAHELSMTQKARDLMQSGKKKLYQDKDARGGIHDFQAALSIEPDYYEVHYQIAMAYLTLGLRGEAETSLRKAIEISGDKYGEADIGLATTKLDNGEFAAGEGLIRRGIELSPNTWLGPYELGRALLNENRIDAAEVAAVQARALAPNAPIIYRLLANVHLRKNNYSAALEDLDAYLRLDPDSPAGARARQIREEIRKKIAVKKLLPTAIDLQR
jgi:tetratricopeptide (TPR) repeat protein